MEQAKNRPKHTIKTDGETAKRLIASLLLPAGHAYLVINLAPSGGMQGKQESKLYPLVLFSWEPG